LTFILDRNGDLVYINENLLGLIRKQISVNEVNKIMNLKIFKTFSSFNKGNSIYHIIRDHKELFKPIQRKRWTLTVSK